MGGEGKEWISWNRWDCWGEGLLHWCVMERAGQGRGGEGRGHFEPRNAGFGVDHIISETYNRASLFFQSQEGHVVYFPSFVLGIPRPLNFELLKKKKMMSSSIMKV